jgi:hypothetical protein
LTITLPSPVDRVGGYLSGAGDSLIPSLTDIYYYDNNFTFIGASQPVTQSNSSSSPAFFGFESPTNEIKYLRIRPRMGSPALPTLDNFTTEVLTAAVPEPSTWALLILGFAGIGYMAYRRRSRPRALAAA